MRYSEAQIQKVRQINIADMLGVRLNRSRMLINCPNPNHNDKTPSFLLDDQNGFKCFGKCGVSGHGWIDFCIFMGYKFEDVMGEYVEN